jgi:hypothetical protein
MKTEPNDQIMPWTEKVFYGEEDQFEREIQQPGLTKREYFAGLIMQGLMANSAKGYSLSRYAADSVQASDALIAELNK